MVTPTEEFWKNIQKETTNKLSWFRETGSWSLLDELNFSSQEEQVKQSINAMKKIPKFEKEAYKIDRDLSIEQKINNWWTKETDSLGYITFLQKNLWDGAYVWEVLEWFEVENEHKGEQKFNREAIKYLWLKEKLPKDYEGFLKIRWNDRQKFMQEYFSKNDKPVLTWFFTPDQTFRHFHDFGILEYCWLWDGNSIDIRKDWCSESLTPGHVGCSPRFGLSVRLIKLD